MLTDMIDYRSKINEEVKAMQSKIKGNVKGRKLGLKSMISNRRKK